MIDNTNPIQGVPPNNSPMPSIKADQPPNIAQNAAGGDHNVMGMHMDDKEFKKFISNLCNFLGSQVAQYKDRMKAAEDQMKQAENGDI